MTNRTFTAAMLSLGLAGAAGAPAFANGAASTRNILLGGAAAAVGTLLIINHNKQVHQHYADDAHRQADTQAQANNAQAAYAAERRAYQNELAVNTEYQREVAAQHTLIQSLRREVAAERSHAAVARTSAPAQSAQRAASVVAAAGPRVAAPAPRTAAATPSERPLNVASTSWGWGQL